jgi:hypothetical protein
MGAIDAHIAPKVVMDYYVMMKSVINALIDHLLVIRMRKSGFLRKMGRFALETCLNVALINIFLTVRTVINSI